MHDGAPTIVLAAGDGSIATLARELARRLPVQTLSTSIGEQSAEQFNLPPRAAMHAIYRDLAFVRRLRAIEGLLHLPSHHLARYGTWLREPFIVTVHDLIRQFDRDGNVPLIHRPNRRDRLMLELDLAGIRRAAALISVSETTKRDVVAHLGLPESRIHVVSPGIDTDAFRPRPGRPLPHPYVLFVGSEHPRKNLEGLLAAFALLKRDGNPKLKLVKVGAPGGAEGPFRAHTLRSIRRLGLQREVRLLGHVEHDRLVSLYAGAQCLVLPSLYEGFGLPPLEAMACGCPALVSDRGALPEIAGPAALVSAPSPAGLARAMARLLSDDQLRAQLVQRGLRHVRTFSWAAAAAATEAVYQRVQDAARGTPHGETGGITPGIR